MAAYPRSTSFLKLALALAVGSSACGSPRGAVSTPPPLTIAPTTTPVPTATPNAERIDVEDVMNHVRTLAVEIGLRNSGSNGDVRASEYVAGRIAALGWNVERRPFPLPQGGQSWNVVGTPSGFDDTRPYLIVGGHYDSLNGPGANDNATGVAVALEIARSVARSPAALPVMFVGFGAEERQPTPKIHHHVGSRWYVSHMSPAAKDALVAMVNVDMVGWGRTIYCPRLATGPREGADRCLRIASDLDIRAKPRVTPDWSDSGSFLKAGMDAVWLWTGDDPCCNHSPKDTMARVRPRDVDQAATLALAIMRSYTG